MANRYDPYAKDDEEIEGYGAGQWLTGIGGGAASGAVTGGTIGGPWGAVIGGVVGAGAGAVSTGLSEEEYRKAQEQQNALNADLGDRSIYDNLIAQQGQREALTREANQVAAQQAAARGNLTPGSTIALQRNVERDQALAAGMERGSLYNAAQQMDLARRNQVLEEYGVAQSLANNAAPSDNFNKSMGALTAAASEYGTYASSKETTADATAPIARDESIALDPTGAQVMKNVSAQAVTSPEVRNSMQGLSVEEQAALIQAYPEAYDQSFQRAPRQELLVPDTSMYARTSPEFDPLSPTLAPPRASTTPAPAVGGGVPPQAARPAPQAAPRAASAAAPRPQVAPKATQPTSPVRPLPGAPAGSPTVHPDTVKASEAGDANALLSRMPEVDETSDAGYVAPGTLVDDPRGFKNVAPGGPPVGGAAGKVIDAGVERMTEPAPSSTGSSPAMLLPALLSGKAAAKDQGIKGAARFPAEEDAQVMATEPTAQENARLGIKDPVPMLKPPTDAQMKKVEETKFNLYTGRTDTLIERGLTENPQTLLNNHRSGKAPITDQELLIELETWEQAKKDWEGLQWEKEWKTKKKEV